MFKKGVLFGVGMLSMMLMFIPIQVLASQLLSVGNNDVGNYQITPLGYEFVWVSNEYSPVQLSSMLGVTVNSIQSGRIVVGTEKKVMPDGKTYDVPLLKNGKKVVFATLPSTDVAAKLDYQYGLQGFERVGGKSVVDTLQKVDTTVIQ